MQGGQEDHEENEAQMGIDMMNRVQRGKQDGDQVVQHHNYRQPAYGDTESYLELALPLHCLHFWPILNEEGAETHHLMLPLHPPES